MIFIFLRIEVWAEEHLRPTVFYLVGQSCRFARFDFRRLAVHCLMRYE